jgi:hypothetical protein
MPLLFITAFVALEGQTHKKLDDFVQMSVSV